MARLVPGPVPLGNAVFEYRIGNARVIVCDDAYRGRSDEDQRKSLLNISRISSDALADKLAGKDPGE